MADPRYDQIPDVQRLAGAVEPGEPGVLVRSEERLNVSTQRFTTGRARLEKYLITETRTITVEVTREEVRLVHDDTSPTAPADPARPTDLGSPAADESSSDCRPGPRHVAGPAGGASGDHQGVGSGWRRCDSTYSPSPRTAK